MDVKLLEQMRRSGSNLLGKWKREVSSEVTGHANTLRELGKSLFALLLDSLQFEGFAELEHLAYRAGRTAWNEKIGLGTLLRTIFLMRDVLENFLNRKTGASLVSNELSREIDRFAATCAREYVLLCEDATGAIFLENLAGLRAAFGALDLAVMVVDSELTVHAASSVLKGLVFGGRAAEGHKLAEVAASETVAALRDLLKAESLPEGGEGCATGVVPLESGTADASITRVGSSSGALFVVELHLEASGPCTLSALRNALACWRGAAVFGNMMKQLRREKGVSMRALAEKLGMARGYLSNIENGKAMPSFNAITQIADILDPDGRSGLIVLGLVQRLPENVREKLNSYRADSIRRQENISGRTQEDGRKR